LLVPSERDYLLYSMGTVGAAPLVEQWLNLAPPGSNTSTRCTESPCVKVLVYDELWAQFKIHDADGSGAPAPHHTLKWLHTNSAVETWLPNGA
jgi:hypothetical protein